MSKHIFIALIAIVGSILQVYCQNDSSGIYLNAQDFDNKKLSFAIDCRTEKHKIRLNDFFIKNYITVIHNDTSYKLYKSAIFGYRMCDGKVIRFQEKKELLLLNSGEPIMIYRHDVAKPPRGKTNATNYYFSKDASSPVLRLTISNLKKAYPGNQFFQKELDRLFRYNTELAVYDPAHSMYKLNWMLNNYSMPKNSL